VKRFIFPAVFISSIITAPAASADADAEAARILRGAADDLRTTYRALDEQTLYLFAGMSTGSEFEEMEILERLARSDRGREAVAAACREALAGDDAVVKLVAFHALSRIDRTEADAYLPDLYDALGEGDVLMLATVAETALYLAPDEAPAGGAEELYGRLARDLSGDDPAASLKAAKLVALMRTERARELAAEGMRRPDARVRRWCVMALAYAYDGFAQTPPDYGAVEAALRDEDPSVRAFAARRLGNTGDGHFILPLLALLDDADVDVRRAAAGSLSSLLAYSPVKDTDVPKELLERLKAEPDGLTRCRLGQAYGAATVDKEGWARLLTDDGYWAFFTNQWREKDLDGYYTESESGCGGGG
jgi:HEAT repeat protein